MENEMDDGILPGNDQLPSQGDFQLPPLEELLKALDGMDMSEQEKTELRESLISRAQQAANTEYLSQQAHDHVSTSGNVAPEFLILIAMISIVSLIFAFFGYKLYKSLVERERRREEKRRQKQQKKKK